METFINTLKSSSL